jgi:hypothetical protein
VQRVFQHPLSLTLSRRHATKVFCELVFYNLVMFRERLAHSEGSETAMMEQDSADWA